MSDDRESQARFRRAWWQRCILALGVFLTFCSVAAAVSVAYLGYKYDKVEKYDISLTPVAPGKPANFLVVGSDSREGMSDADPNSGAFLDGAASGRRSDTILIVHIDPAAESVSMLSLPRDLWVPIAGTGGHQRINAAYGLGKQVLSDTIQQYLGIPINHYVEVDFRGFQALVNAVGGVPMYFERAMRDLNSGLDVLHPGCVTLDGASGLSFARSRHLEFIDHGVWRSDPTGDLGRITRQQLFVRRALSRAVSKGLSNPLTLSHLIDIGVSNVGIDSGLSPKGLADLGRRFASFNSENLATYSVPVTPFRTRGGADVLALDAEAAVPTLDLFRITKGQVPDESGSAGPLPTGVGSVPVRVLNGSGIDLRATNVAGALQAAGFPVTGTGNVSEIGGTAIDHSEIHYPQGGQANAELLARHLRGGARLVADDVSAGGEVVLVVGRDLTAVTAAESTPVEPSTQATSSTLAPTNTTPAVPDTTAVGRTPGEAPPGVSC